jgi:hypothetical protein
VRTGEETVFSITRFENRVRNIKAVENFSLYFPANWSLTFATGTLFLSVFRTQDTKPIVVIGLQAIFMTGHKQWYDLSRILKNFNVRKFPIIHEHFHV